MPDRWWESFEDPSLNRVIDEALSGNLDLKMAWSRMEQARAVARQAGAQGRLQLSYSAGAQKSRSFLSVGGHDRSSENDSLTQSVAASYEVDVWNRYASQERAAELDWQSSRDEVETLAISLTATLTDIWFTLIERRALLELLDRQIAVSQTFLDLTEARYGQGITSAVDVFQQRGQVASIQSQRAPVESQVLVLHHQLAVLLGHSPGEVFGRDLTELPGLLPLPSIGVPTDLLIHRPDIRAARQRLAAADHRIAAAIADRYPVLSLTGRMGLGGDEIEKLFSNWIWSLAANLAAPILDGDRRAAEVDRTRAVVKERLYSYGHSLLTAIQEVENALAQEQKQREYLERLAHQLTIAQQTLDETRSRYMAGLSEYLPVLTALQSMQSVERSELQARRDLLGYRIQLHRALGGRWPSFLENNTLSGVMIQQKTL